MWLKIIDNVVNLVSLHQSTVVFISLLKNSKNLSFKANTITINNLPDLNAAMVTFQVKSTSLTLTPNIAIPNYIEIWVLNAEPQRVDIS